MTIDVTPLDGAQLRAARKAANASQQRLAERAHCSLSMVKLLERGYQPNQSDVLERITRALTALSTETRETAQALNGETPGTATPGARETTSGAATAGYVVGQAY